MANHVKPYAIQLLQQLRREMAAVGDSAQASVDIAEVIAIKPEVVLQPLDGEGTYDTDDILWNISPKGLKKHDLLTVGRDPSGHILVFGRPDELSPDPTDHPKGAKMAKQLTKIRKETETWKSPKYAKADLPLTDNTDGDIRLVSSEWEMYVWKDAEETWAPLNSNVGIADVTGLTAALALKADLTYVDGQITTVNSALALKADLTYVNGQISGLASTYVDVTGDSMTGALRVLNAKVGDWAGGGTYGAFANQALYGASNSYALMQGNGTADKATYLNAMSGGSIIFRNNNADVATMDSSGFSLATGVQLSIPQDATSSNHAVRLVQMNTALSGFLSTTTAASTYLALGGGNLSGNVTNGGSFTFRVGTSSGQESATIARTGFFAKKDNADTYNVASLLALSGVGTVLLGPGTAPPDWSLAYSGANIASLGSGDVIRDTRSNATVVASGDPTDLVPKAYVDGRVVVSSTAPTDTTALWIDPTATGTSGGGGDATTEFAFFMGLI